MFVCGFLLYSFNHSGLINSELSILINFELQGGGGGGRGGRGGQYITGDCGSRSKSLPNHLCKIYWGINENVQRREAVHYFLWKFAAHSLDDVDLSWRAAGLHVRPDPATDERSTPRNTGRKRREHKFNLGVKSTDISAVWSADRGRGLYINRKIYLYCDVSSKITFFFFLNFVYSGSVRARLSMRDAVYQRS